jgi:DNA-directed RNA polymerase subunit M/transcription elongation factor TFIIS
MNDEVQASLVMDVLELRYGKSCDTLDEVRSVLRHMGQTELVCILSAFPTANALLTHFHQNGNQFSFWNLDAIQHGPIQRWSDYCVYVERHVQGTDNEEVIQTSVFGTCRKCGSSRLTVRTKQLRRADEGATELRTCRDCGYTSRINS